MRICKIQNIIYTKIKNKHLGKPFLKFYQICFCCDAGKFESDSIKFEVVVWE